jgi:uncharacterized protein (TIGR03435 family)
MKPMGNLPRIAMTVAALALVAKPQTGSDGFEVASIKPAGANASLGELGRKGGGGSGCDGSFPKVDGGYFSVTTTTYALITWAYGYNKTWGCSYVSFGDLVTGGPSWIRSDRYTIDAKIPADAPKYTLDQFMRGDAPGLERMLQVLLADRFQLVVHKETKNVSGYALTLSKEGSKLSPSKPDDKRTMMMRRETGPNGEVFDKMTGEKVEMRDLAFLLLMTTQRPVIDRTGINGEYNFDMDFAPFRLEIGIDSNAPSLFTALEQKLGLRMEGTKAALDGLVIDRAERPSEN